VNHGADLVAGIERGLDRGALGIWIGVQHGIDQLVAMRALRRLAHAAPSGISVRSSS
jgi:hypothetical protein